MGSGMAPVTDGGQPSVITKLVMEEIFLAPQHT